MTRDELLAKHGEPVRVLDHGHVRLIDVMGDDERVEQVARLSYVYNHAADAIERGEHRSKEEK